MSVNGERSKQLFLKFNDTQFKKRMSQLLLNDCLMIDEKFLDVKIKEIFYENKFNSFVSFCSEQNVEVVGELTSELISDYFYGRGIGPKKVENVLSQLNRIKEIRIIRYLEPTDNYQGMEKISLVFGEQSYLSFVTYCKKAKKNLISELDYEFLMEYSQQKGVGTKKFNNILQRLEPYAVKLERNDAELLFSCDAIFEKIKDMPLSRVAKMLNCPLAVTNQLLIKEIEGRKIEELEEKISIEALIFCRNELQKIKTLQTIFDELEVYLKQKGTRDWDIIKYKAEEGATLQSVADQMGITRERVRQLINKTVKKIDIYFTQNQLIKTLKLYSNQLVNISYEEFLQLIEEKHVFIIKIMKEYSNLIYYIDEFDRFYFENAKLKRDKFRTWLAELPDIFNYNIKQKQMNNLLAELDIETLQEKERIEILSNYGFKKNGEAFSKNNLTLIKVAEYLFENYFQMPFKLDEKGVEIFQKYAKKYLDFDYTDGTIRNLDARFRDSNQIIAVDSFTYIWFDGTFDMEIISEIDAYINKQLELESVISASEIFERFKARIYPLGITTPYHLYYIVKYYLNEKYQIGRGNTLEIYRDEASVLTAEEMLLNYLEKRGGIAKKSDICQALKWEPYRIEQRVGESRHLIIWDGDYVRRLKEIYMTEEEISELKTMLNKLLQKQYTTGDMILKEIEKHPKLKAILKREEFSNPNNLVVYCKKIADLKGHTSFLVTGEGRYDSIYDVISEKYKACLTRNELRKFLSSLGYGEQMPGTVIRKLIEDKKYIEIDVDEICHKNAFSIDSNIKAQVLSFLQEKMGNQEYLTLSNLTGYEEEFPKIEFSWTQQMIKSIALNHGYKQIEKTHPDYRYEKIILVKETSSLRTFEELLVYIIKNEYVGSLHENQVYAYLEEKGIVKHQERTENKTFSQRILRGSLIEIDDNHFIKLKDI